MCVMQISSDWKMFCIRRLDVGAMVVNAKESGWQQGAQSVVTIDACASSPMSGRRVGNRVASRRERKERESEERGQGSNGKGKLLR